MTRTSEQMDTGKRKSKVLWEITLLVVVVYVIGGLAAFLIAQNSYNNLSEESVNKLIEEKADTISSSYNYLVKAQTDILFKEYDVSSVNLPDFYSKLIAGDKNDLDPLQAYINDKLETMMEEGLLDLQYLFMIIPPNPLSKNPITLASSDPDLVFANMPTEISDAVEEGRNWIILEDGIPALGLTGEQLVVFTKIKSPLGSDVMVNFVGITDMSSDIAEIRQFYDDEKQEAMVEWGVITLVSIVIIMIITFFILRWLIRKRITEPIDILSAEAGEVMEGNLDIDVLVHKGGEFEGLETAFKKMVESFRTYIARSTEEE